MIYDRPHFLNYLTFESTLSIYFKLMEKQEAIKGLNIIIISKNLSATFGITNYCLKCTLANEYKLWNLCVVHNSII